MIFETIHGNRPWGSRCQTCQEDFLSHLRSWYKYLPLWLTKSELKAPCIGKFIVQNYLNSELSSNNCKSRDKWLRVEWYSKLPWLLVPWLCWSPSPAASSLVRSQRCTFSLHSSWLSFWSSMLESWSWQSTWRINYNYRCAGRFWHGDELHVSLDRSSDPQVIV
jgi:hypothetical protein